MRKLRIGGTSFMSKRYFGTDGIRGQANKFPMTAEVAMKVGMAAGMSFHRGKHRHRVVVGKDTRLSGYMIENAMVAGFYIQGDKLASFKNETWIKVRGKIEKKATPQAAGHPPSPSLKRSAIHESMAA